MPICRTEIPQLPMSTELDASGPKHISQVLQEWARQHEALLTIDGRPQRPMPSLPVSCATLVLGSAAVV